METEEGDLVNEVGIYFSYSSDTYMKEKLNFVFVLRKIFPNFDPNLRKKWMRKDDMTMKESKNLRFNKRQLFRIK